MTARIGKTNRLSIIDVMSPPRMTAAIGPSISRPGAFISTARGASPSAVTSDVMSTGTTRSLAPRSAVVTPHVRALLEIRYDRFSRGFERDSKAGCGRQHNEAAWPELHARRNAIRLI
ncbi:Putative transcriptional regulator (plasmid) [Gluconobacter oxydans 621H]|uniref:Putative transcriptional regulator n=1 Tax=Gluconobacter oxydans (strain 621H) TaxID=290633 RepID=Q5HXY1_GLUOX|nr:Putative transcriptional regulator [Gluconobacter oxydans 621H]